MGNTSRPLNVVVAEPAHLARAGLVSFLGACAGLRVVGDAVEVEAALRLTEAEPADVGVVSSSLATAKALAQFSRAGLRGRVVVLGDAPSAGEARAALLAGAAAFVSEQSHPETLLEAIHVAAREGRYLDPALGAAVVQHQCAEESGERLTPRERDVLRLVVLGHTNREMAEELDVGIRTIEAHRLRLQQKVGASTRAELFAFAREHRPSEPPPARSR
jgi:DNA-binding NarL/FixJ family response regulator